MWIFLSVLIAFLTLCWYIYSRYEPGKLEIHFLPEVGREGTYICAIVNAGVKPITPIGVNLIVNKKICRIEAIRNGEKLGKALPPGEMIQLLYKPDTEVLGLLSQCDKIIVVDALSRTFSLSSKELKELKKFVNDNFKKELI
ncbi:MAG: hypothetical protein ACI352_07030 [Elusimicrobiaceae bacterium]